MERGDTDLWYLNYQNTLIGNIRVDSSLLHWKKTKLVGPRHNFKIEKKMGRTTNTHQAIHYCVPFCNGILVTSYMVWYFELNFSRPVCLRYNIDHGLFSLYSDYVFALTEYVPNWNTWHLVLLICLGFYELLITNTFWIARYFTYTFRNYCNYGESTHSTDTKLGGLPKTGPRNGLSTRAANPSAAEPLVVLKGSLRSRFSLRL